MPGTTTASVTKVGGLGKADIDAHIDLTKPPYTPQECEAIGLDYFEYLRRRNKAVAMAKVAQDEAARFEAVREANRSREERRQREGSWAGVVRGISIACSNCSVEHTLLGDTLARKDQLSLRYFVEQERGGLIVAWKCPDCHVNQAIDLGLVDSGAGPFWVGVKQLREIPQRPSAKRLEEAGWARKLVRSHAGSS